MRLSVHTGTYIRIWCHPLFSRSPIIMTAFSSAGPGRPKRQTNPKSGFRGNADANNNAKQSQTNAPKHANIEGSTQGFVWDYI